MVADFGEWWASYPRKVGKDAARRAYAKVRAGRDGPSAGELLLAMRAQAEGWDDPQFIVHPTTWLNQGWKDGHRASSRAIVAPDRRTETMEQKVSRMIRERRGDRDDVDLEAVA